MFNLNQFATAVKASNNPMQLFNQAARSNPQVAQVMRLMQGKSPAEFRQVVENMAKERGTTLEQVVNQMGLKLPK